MSRAAFVSLCAAALALGLAFRLIGLDARPMHHDEANQAVKFGALLEDGDYRYDRTDHHGPTLYYLTLPAAWLRGQASLAALDERTVRLVPAVFGAGLIPLFLFLERRIGRPAVAAAALLAAVSPALTYYGRFYIQETLFAFFTLGLLFALGRYGERPGPWPAGLAGLFGGLAYATKETSLIVGAAALAAYAGTWLPWPKPFRSAAGQPGERAALEDARHVATPRWWHAALAVLAGAGVAFLFYSSFFANPGGFVESILAFSVYFERGLDASRHAQPWDFYLRTLGWSASGGLVWTEAFILVLAVVGTVAAFRAPAETARWPRYLALYSWVAALVFSALRYKTPWNVLPFHVGFVLMAGVGFAALAGHRGGQGFSRADGRRDVGQGFSLANDRPAVGQGFSLANDRPAVGQGFSLAFDRPLRVVLAIALLLAGAAHLGVQAWRANLRYGADPRNPYVYAHTTPDFLGLARRVSDLSAIHHDGTGMLVKVFAGPYEQWPLPWYLRRMTQVGYWSRAAEAPSTEAPVVIASQENAPAVDAALGDRYVSEFYGLRPNVLLTLYVERDLWDRFIASRQ